MSSEAAEDEVTFMPGAVHSVKTTIAAVFSTAVSSSPVSDLAQNLEVLSTDGFGSQGSSSTDG